MTHRKIPNLMLLVVMIASLLLGGGVPVGAQNNQSPTIARNSGVAAAPINPTDETKVPHYFGPNPNWALSPFTLPDVTVTFSGGGGAGATATASVGANGAITGITITNPGSGYTSAPAVAITGAGTNATANAVVTLSGVVTAINVGANGAGYTAPAVSISGGGATITATATANGGVDAVAIVSGGAGYTNPTVEFDMPNDPNGTSAKGHAVLVSGVVTQIVVDDPGSGYYAAPTVRVYNGTLFDPIACLAARAAAARAATMKSNDQGKFAPESAAKATVTDSAAKAAAALAPFTSAADCGAIATATLKVLSVTVDTLGVNLRHGRDRQWGQRHRHYQRRRRHCDQPHRRRLRLHHAGRHQKVHRRAAWALQPERGW